MQCISHQSQSIMLSIIACLYVILTHICQINSSVPTGSNVIQLSIIENAPIGTVVGSIASQGFSPPFQTNPWDFSEFELSRETGKIIVMGDVDREVRTAYSFLAISDSTGEVRNVLIMVKDENDNAPRFNTSLIEKSVPENYPVGSKFDLTKVFDPDEGENSIKSVRIISGDPEGQFDVDKTDLSNGYFYLRLVLRLPLDHESVSQYNILLQALDGGSPPRQATLTVRLTVLNANDNLPKFDLSRYAAAVREDTLVGTFILQLSATDRDAGESGQLTYSIDRPPDEFSIDPRTGRIHLSAALDYERRQSYELTAEVRDNAPPHHTARVPVTIEVQDVNDNAPSIEVAWTTNPHTVDCRIEPGSVLAHIRVTDADTVSVAFGLRIIDAPPSTFGVFKVLSTMWEVRTMAAITQLAGRNISIILEAADGPIRPLTSRRTIIIAIMEPPILAVRFSRRIFSTILDSPVVTSGQPILTPTVVGPRDGGYLFGFASNVEDVKFNIDPNSGAVTAVTAIECGTYQLNMTVLMRGTQRVLDTALLLIDVQGQRKVPVYFQYGFHRIVVKTGTRGCFYQISAANRHCGLKIKYHIDSLLTAAGPFRVTSHGTFCIDDTVDATLYFSTRYVYRLNATDIDGSSASTIVLISVIADLVLVTNDIWLTVPLDTTNNRLDVIGRVLATSSATSPVLFYGSILYSIVQKNSAAFAISVDKDSGEMRQVQAIRKNINFTVSAVWTRDNFNVHSRVVSVCIFVGKLYFEKRFYSFRVRSKDTRATSLVIGTVAVSRNSVLPSDSVTYLIVDDSDYRQYLSVDPFSGQLTGHNLVNLNDNVIMVTVGARRKGIDETCYAQVLITIQRNSDQVNFPYSALYVDVWENSVPETEIVQTVPSFVTLDGRFTVVNGKYSSWISVHPVTGQMFLRKSFDREQVERVVVTIELADGIDSVKTDIHLKIVDVNDNHPQCSDSSVNLSVPDNTSIGYKFCSLKCVDRDASVNGLLRYAMKMTSPIWFHNPFQMNMKSGCFDLVAGLDTILQTTSEQLAFLVTVSDSGIDVQLETVVKIVITITDSNNHRPKLINYPKYHVLQDSPEVLKVGTLSFEDRDHGANADVSAVVLDSYYSKYFTIDKINTRTSVIYLNNALEKKVSEGQHYVAIELKDGGLPPLTAKINLLIVVSKSSFDHPVITYPTMNEQIFYSCPCPMGSKILTVEGHASNSKFVYAIQGNSDRFFISKSGEIHSKQSLSCFINVNLAIYAFYPGTDVRSSVIDITLSPKNAAYFGRCCKNVSFVVDEGMTVGTVIGSLNNVCGSNNLGYKFVFSNNSTISEDRQLYIDYESASLLLLSNELDDISDIYEIVSMFDRAVDPPKSSMFYIGIMKNKRNMEWPTFADITPKVMHIEENAPIGSYIYNFSIGMKDDYSVRYFLKQPKEYFMLDPYTGILVSFLKIDKESEEMNDFFIEVTVVDVSCPTRKSVAAVQMIIDDENDNSPTIVSPKQHFIDINYPLSSNRSLVRIIATDADSGPNAELRFSLSWTEESSLFSIDPLVGDIWLTSTPIKQTYELNVTVTDAGSPSRSSWGFYTIRLFKSSKKNQISLSKKPFVVNISLPQSGPGTVIAKISVETLSSLPANPPVIYHINAGRYSTIFTIDATSGEIKTARPVTIADLPFVESIQMSVIAQDAADIANYDVSDVLIFIDHGNRYSPRFARDNYIVKLPEEKAITDFLTVAADDPDFGKYGEVSYMLKGDVFDRRITIDPTTGRLSCSPLNFKEKNIYNLQVIAHDSHGEAGYRSGSTHVTIFVNNTKEITLQFNATHYSLDIMENSPSRSYIGTILIHNHHQHSGVYYSLNPGHPYIDLDPVTGQLRTNGPLDREKTNIIEMTIHAFISTALIQTTVSASAMVNVRILDQNDNPPEPTQNPVVVLLSDLRAVPSPIATISASDPDSLTNISYNFDNTDSATATQSIHYRLDSGSGKLFYKTSTVKITKARHLLRVIVSDGGKPVRNVTVLVDVRINTNIHHLEIAPQKAVFRINENSPPGSFVGELSVAQGCSGEQVQFSIIDGISSDLILLHATNGKILTKLNIDREQHDKITLWIQASCDRSGSVGYKKVTVHIDDVDDNQPKFSQAVYHAIVIENQPPDTPVIKTNIFDPDIGLNNEVDYFFELSTPLDEFVIDVNGLVKTRVPLNYHTKSQYSLIIKATSKSSPHLYGECRLIIHVVNINDQRPVFPSPSQKLDLQEDTAVGKLVGKVTAKDSDGPDGISYSIRPRGLTNDTWFLSVVYDSGEIFLSRRIKSSEVKRHEFDIVADDGKYSSTMIFSVNIIDINNQNPVLVESGSAFILRDNLQKGSMIALLHATDADVGQNAKVNFYINPPSDSFGIINNGNNTASVYLKSNQLTTKDTIFLPIEVIDDPANQERRLSTTSTLFLVAQSSNPNSPRFTNGSAGEAFVKQSIKSGTLVTRVKCVDDDKDQFTTSYLNVSGDINNIFHIDPKTGNLYITSELNGFVRQYRLTIICEDTGAPSRSASFWLLITVEKTAQTSAKSNRTIEQVVKNPVKTTSPVLLMDFPDSSYKYVVVSTVPTLPTEICPKTKFSVDDKNHLWLSNGNLSDASSWLLTVQVHQRTTSEFRPVDYLYVNVSGMSRSSNEECISLSKLTAVVKENGLPGTTVLQLPRFYEDIRYSMETNEAFSLKCHDQLTSDCAIVTKSQLDFESRDQYDLPLVIRGSVSSSVACSHSVLLKTFVLDVDEYSPEFGQRIYKYRHEGNVPELGQVVFSVKAIDRDKGRFGLVFYKFDDDQNEHFGIKNDTGEIFIRTKFPTEKDTVKNRSKRSADSEKKKFEWKTFWLKIVASSGVLSSNALVELELLIPFIPKDGSTNSAHILPLAYGIPVGVVILLLVAIIGILVKKKTVTCKNSTSWRSSQTESPRTASSSNTKTGQQLLHWQANGDGYKDKKLFDPTMWPDVTKVNQNRNIRSSDTQESMLDFDGMHRNSTIQTSNSPIYDSEMMVSHSSGASSERFEDGSIRTGGSTGQMLSANFLNDSQIIKVPQFKSTTPFDTIHPDSDHTSSSTYSVISQNASLGRHRNSDLRYKVNVPNQYPGVVDFSNSRHVSNRRMYNKSADALELTPMCIDASNNNFSAYNSNQIHGRLYSQNYLYPNLATGSILPNQDGAIQRQPYMCRQQPFFVPEKYFQQYSDQECTEIN